jgi:hypothetical protein
MEKSESIKNLATALVKFNSEVGKIHKKSENPFFKSKYAALPDILSEISEPLQKSGLVVIQFPDGNSLTTMLIHSESGEYLSSTAEMKPVKTDPQSLGSAITYYRRYMLASILSLNIDEDDDGNKGSKLQQTKPEMNISPKLVDIEKCETVNQLNDLWDANKELQKNKQFIQEMKNKKQLLIKNL